MIVDFQQGIVSYPSLNSQASGQQFLAYSGGYVSLLAANDRTDIAFAHGTEDYLITESTNVTNAWGPLPSSTDVWLYWDIDLRSAARTFGFTLVQPTSGPTAPTTPTEDMHWFDTYNKKMMLYHSGGWRNVVRVFAAKANNAVFTPLGSGANSKPFAGSQVGLNTPSTRIGRIMVDNTGTPIKRSSGLFFTTEDDFFVQGSPVSAIRLEANIFNGTALETIAKYQVTKFSQFGKLNLATYSDTQSTIVAMCMESLIQNQTGALCLQGSITNPEWNWSTVGAPLWIHGTIPGMLTDIDPHVADPVTFNTGFPPVARVVTSTSIFFDQGLGGKGDRGVQGPAGVAAASTIAIPPYQGLTGTTISVQIQQLYDQQVNVAGATMTGTLILPATVPMNPLEAVTKSYVDSRSGITSFNTRTGSITLTSQDVTTALTYTPAGLASPAFTGIPTAPTATPGTGSTQLATTAFVVAADNLKADVNSPAFTGIPTAPTASLHTNTAQLATSAFVLAELGALTLSSISQLNSSLSITDTGTNGTLTLTLDGHTKLSATKNAVNVLNAEINPNNWVAILGDLGNNLTTDTGSSTAIDSVGNVIVSGGTGTMFPSSGLLVKYNPTGTIIWQARHDSSLGGSVYHDTVVVDHADNIITLTYTASDGYQCVKWSGVDGTIIWQVAILRGGTTSTYTAAVDSTNNIIVCGGGTSSPIGLPVLKISSVGMLVWSTQLTSVFNPVNGYIDDVTVDAADNIYITATDRPQVTTGVGSVIKLTSSGVVAWMNTIHPSGTLTTTYCFGITSGAYHVYVTGYVIGSAGLRPAIWKLDATTGAVVWSYMVSTPYYHMTNAYSITIDPITDTLFVTISDVPIAGHQTDMILMAISSSGTLMWAVNIGSTGVETSWYSWGKRNVAFRAGYLSVAGYTNLVGNSLDAFIAHLPGDGSGIGVLSNGFSITPTTVTLTAAPVIVSAAGFTQSVLTTTLPVGTMSAPVVGTLADSVSHTTDGITLSTNDIIVDRTITTSGLSVATTQEALSNPAITGGVLTLNLSTANTFNVALNADITTLSLLNVALPGITQGFVLILTADGIVRTITWPTSFVWAGGTPPTLTSAAGKRDVFSIMTIDGGVTWMAFIPGQNL